MLSTKSGQKTFVINNYYYFNKRVEASNPRRVVKRVFLNLPREMTCVRSWKQVADKAINFLAVAGGNQP